MNLQNSVTLPGFQRAFDSACESLEQSQTFGTLVNSICAPKRFRNEFTHEQRLSEASRQLTKYPSRIPLVLEDDPRSTPVRPNDSKRKYLVPRDMSFGEFMHVVRRRANVGPEKAIFLFIERDLDDGTRSSLLPPTAHTLGTLYEQHKEKDCFLYVVCAAENTFG